MSLEMPNDFKITTTTQGRQGFTRYLREVSEGETILIAFQRGKRAIGAMASLDAVRLLAGEPVDEGARARITIAARGLIAALEGE